MKLFKKLRKGFTLIELVVVIAVIAVLAAVSVVSYIAITNNAKKSNDQQLIDQVNLSLKSHEISKKPSTMHEALIDVEEDGFIPANFKITPEFKGYTFAYNLKDNQFVILNEQKAVVYPKDARKDAPRYDLWLFADSEADVEGELSDFSHYTRAFKWESGSDHVLTAKAGIDLGSIESIGKVKYATNEAQNVVVRTVGDQTELELNAPNSNADFYGFTKKLDVTAIKNASLHIYGTVFQMEVESGHVAVENTGIVFDVTEIGSSASVSNAGYIAENTSGETIEGKPASSEYEINSLERLEGFRDAVNAGNNFDGLTVKLTQDIALKDGWRPIGEGTRHIGATNLQPKGTTTFFAGTFDGQNHTISNLNNKNFRPTASRLVKDDGVDTYAYGLFALAQKATFRNVKLTNVNIDEAAYSGAHLDSVGALVGYTNGGAVVVENVTATGSIKASDSAGGIIGRAYATLAGASLTVTGCTNNVAITTTKKSGGVVGYTTCNSVFTNCVNNANVTVSSQCVAGIASAADVSLSFVGCSNNGVVGPVGAHADLCVVINAKAKSTGISGEGISYCKWGSDYAILINANASYTAGQGVVVAA